MKAINDQIDFQRIKKHIRSENTRDQTLAEFLHGIQNQNVREGADLVIVISFQTHRVEFFVKENHAASTRFKTDVVRRIQSFDFIGLKQSRF
ncbi:hypothetical protein D3C72_1699520 [compost metagenome]